MTEIASGVNTGNIDQCTVHPEGRPTSSAAVFAGEGGYITSTGQCPTPLHSSGLNPRSGHSGFSHVGIVLNDVVGFSRGSPVSLALSFRRCSIFTSNTLIGSQDLDVKSLCVLEVPRPVSDVLRHRVSEPVLVVACCPSWTLRTPTTMGRHMRNSPVYLRPCCTWMMKSVAWSPAHVVFFKFLFSQLRQKRPRRQEEWGGQKREITENTLRPAASSGTIPTCENPRVAWPGIELDSLWWGASRISNRQFRRFEKNFNSISSPALNTNGATVFCVDLRSDLGLNFEPRWWNLALEGSYKIDIMTCKP
ncbi:hypothetical protein PR048_030062 [Dryococelus australis]|uniref:Uncharacterized protein n=1 Tax=Dryococelus australis TaxID=614101 RepID=A0ABQ9G7X0_9NEOP|nr:hypothetical protein PR048_030062 [Dryococelus australis]